jgi:preprotein translocase subunit YajC
LFAQEMIGTMLLQSGGGSAMGLIVTLVPMALIFYFLLILPQQRRQKKWQHMLAELKAGDKVVTSGGIRGTIIALRDQYIHLRVPPDNLRIEVNRSAVVATENPEEQKEKAS